MIKTWDRANVRIAQASPVCMGVNAPSIGGPQMVPNLTTILQCFTGEGAVLLQPDAILTVCAGRSGIPRGASACSRRSPPCSSSWCRCSMAIPPVVICPIGRAYGSAQRPTVKRAPNSRSTSSPSSSSASAARCSELPWTTGGGRVIVPFSSRARDAPCPIRRPYRTRSASRRSSGRGAAFPSPGSWGGSMRALACS
jgi:hypothetical protein